MGRVNLQRLKSMLETPAGGLAAGAAIGGLVFGYGVLRFFGEPLWTVLGHNKEIAPWFAAAGTTAGVIAALRNANSQRAEALAKEGREIQRKLDEAQKTKAALYESVKGMVAVVEANLDTLDKALPDPATFQGYVDDGTAKVALEHVRSVLMRFSPQLLGSEVHSRAYYSLELGLTSIASRCGALAGETIANVTAAIPDLAITLKHMHDALELLRRPLP